MIYMENKDIESGPTEFPDSPDVVTWYEARGWFVVDAPEPKPFIPTPGTAVEGVEWVSLKHSETGATHDFPNNPDALAGAADVGWGPVDNPKDKAPAKPKKKAEPKPAADTPKETE